MLYIVLVNWNGEQDTIECLQSLRDNSEPCRVLICDNCSRPESSERIIRWVSAIYGPPTIENCADDKVQDSLFWRALGNDSLLHVQFFQLCENYGFAAGNNVGIRAALAEPDCDYIFLLNSDTVVSRDALRHLREKMQAETDLAVCGATLVYYDDDCHTQGLGGTIDLLRARTGSIFRNGDVTSLPEESAVEPQIHYVIGAALFVRASVFRRTGGLSEDYFLFFEELDLSRRLKNGERLGWCRKAVIKHKVGSAIGTNSKGRSSNVAIYYDQRSKILFYKRFHPKLIPFLLYRTLYTIAAYTKKADFTGCRLVIIATLDALFGRMRYPSEIK